MEANGFDWHAFEQRQDERFTGLDSTFASGVSTLTSELRNIAQEIRTLRESGAIPTPVLQQILSQYKEHSSQQIKEVIGPVVKYMCITLFAIVMAVTGGGKYLRSAETWISEITSSTQAETPASTKN